MIYDIKYLEIYRIKIARCLNVPPDDIDFFSLYRCLERGIQRQIVLNEGECSISPQTNREKEIVWSPVGLEILYRIFDQEYPFENLISEIKNNNNTINEN